jgi:hypothetical protein
LTSAFGRAEPAIGFVLDLDLLTDVFARAESNIHRPESTGYAEIDVDDPISGFQEALRRRGKDARVRLVL